MKIGFSLGRCIRDIVNGDISIDDVAFIIAATNIKDKYHMANVLNVYIHEPRYLQGCNFDQCMEVAVKLWDSNRILQPRAQGMHRHMQPEDSIWVDIFPTNLSKNESVKKSWDTYRFMLHMVENVDSEVMEVFR